jgi:hypothetical protein
MHKLTGSGFIAYCPISGTLQCCFVVVVGGGGGAIPVEYLQVTEIPAFSHHTGLRYMATISIDGNGPPFRLPQQV